MRAVVRRQIVGWGTGRNEGGKRRGVDYDVGVQVRKGGKEGG